jgi:hypothetical protein
MAPNFFGCPFPHRLMVGEWLVVTRIPIGKHMEKRRRDWRRILPGRSSHIIAPGQGGFPLHGELGLFRRRYGRIGRRCCAQNALYVAMAVCLQSACACARIASTGRLPRSMETAIPLVEQVPFGTPSAGVEWFHGLERSRNCADAVLHAQTIPATIFARADRADELIK